MKELKIKHSIDLFASFALLCIASMTILFGSVWSLTDLRLMFHPKSENDGEGGRVEHMDDVRLIYYCLI